MSSARSASFDAAHLAQSGRRSLVDVVYCRHFVCLCRAHLSQGLPTSDTCCATWTLRVGARAWLAQGPFKLARARQLRRLCALFASREHPNECEKLMENWAANAST